MADEDAHLLGVELVLAQLQLADDDEEPRLEPPVLLVGLHLGPLRDVEHVLDRQRVEAVLLGQGADDAEVAEAVDVDPAHRRPLRAVAVDEARQVLHVLEAAPARASSRCTVMRTETDLPGTAASSCGSMPAAEPGAAFLNRRGSRRPRLPLGGPCAPSAGRRGLRRPRARSASVGTPGGIRGDDLLGAPSLCSSVIVVVSVLPARRGVAQLT